MLKTTDVTDNKPHYRKSEDKQSGSLNKYIAGKKMTEETQRLIIIINS